MHHIVKKNGAIFQAGDLIRNEFRVHKIIGGWEGHGGIFSGMGIVYICSRMPLEKSSMPLSEMQIFAIKAIQGTFRDNIDIRLAFENEIRVWMDLKHCNIVELFFPFYVNNQLFIVMEFVGSISTSFRNTLQSHLTGQPFTLNQAIEWAVQICEGMEYANKKGIICHNDLKPCNILINMEGQVKISDFGIANASQKSLSLNSAQDVSELNTPGRLTLIKTKNGVLCGTPGYIAPERFAGKSTEIQSDIYSFGVILYQMITGQPTPPLSAFLNEIEPAKLMKNIDSPMTKAIVRCLDPNPAKRFVSFEELRDNLEIIQIEKALLPKKSLVEDWIKSQTKDKTIFNLGEMERVANFFLQSDPLKRFTTQMDALVYLDSIGVFGGQVRSLMNNNYLMTPEKWNNKGSTHLSLGEKYKALRCFDEALRIDGTYAPALSNKAMLLMNEGKSQEALDLFQRAVTCDSGKSEYWYNLGKAFERLGKYRKAISKYDQAIEISIRDFDSWNQKGVCLGELGLYDEAVEWFGLMAEHFHSPNVLNSKGFMLEKLSRFDEALKCYDAALIIESKYDTAMYSKAIVLAELGRFEEAVKFFGLVIKTNPKRFWAWLRMARVFEKMGIKSSALMAYRKFVLEAPHECTKEVNDTKNRINVLEKEMI